MTTFVSRKKIYYAQCSRLERLFENTYMTTSFH